MAGRDPQIGDDGNCSVRNDEGLNKGKVSPCKAEGTD